MMRQKSRLVSLIVTLSVASSGLAIHPTLAQGVPTQAEDAALWRGIHEGLSLRQQTILDGLKDPVERAQKEAEFHQRNANDFGGAGAGSRFSTGLSPQQQETLNHLNDNDARRQQEGEFKAQNQTAIALDIASLLTASQEKSLHGIQDLRMRRLQEQSFQAHNSTEFAFLLGHLNDPQFSSVPGSLSPVQQELSNNIENAKYRHVMEILFKRRNAGLTTTPATTPVAGAGTYANRGAGPGVGTGPVAGVGTAAAALSLAPTKTNVPKSNPAFVSDVSGIALPPGALRFGGTTDPAGLAQTLANFAQARHCEALPAERLVWPIAEMNSQRQRPLSAANIRQQVAQQLRTAGYSYADQDISRDGDKDPEGNKVNFWVLNANKPGKTLLGLYLITPQFVGLTWRYLVPANGNTTTGATGNPGSVRRPGDYYYQPADGSESTDDMLRRHRREREQEERDKAAQGGQQSSADAKAQQDAVNRSILNYGQPYVHDLNMGRINNGGWTGN